MLSKQQIGEFAEDRACDYLIRQGMRLITRNYRCRMGEIDLIFLDRTDLVFVEVRYRKPSLFGKAAETVTSHKQYKIIKAAMHYLQCNPYSNACRFDVIAIMPQANNMLDITWIRDAFQVK